MKKHRIPSRIFTLLVYLFLYAPIVLLIIFSFNATKSNRVWGGFSLEWYGELFNNARLLGALRTTVILSVLAAFIATILGTAAAIGFYSMRRRARGICLSVNNIPLTNADIITGVSMMLLFVFAIGLFNDSFLSQWLVKLGVSPEVAAADACRIEHDLSAETFECLKEHVRRYTQEDPT